MTNYEKALALIVAERVARGEDPTQARSMARAELDADAEGTDSQ